MDKVCMHASVELLAGYIGDRREGAERDVSFKDEMREVCRCPGIHNVVLQSTSTTRDNP